MNVIMIAGNIGSVTVLKTKQENDKVFMSIVTNDFILNEKIDNWHSVVLFGQNAIHAKEYAKKGRYAIVHGMINYHKDDDGNIKTQIVGSSIEIKSIAKNDSPGENKNAKNDSEKPEPEKEPVKTKYYSGDRY